MTVTVHTTGALTRVRGIDDKVASMHEHALALGALDEGAPGPRGEFFGAYFRDLDGNKVCCYCLPPKE